MTKIYNWFIIYTTSAFKCPWCEKALDLLKVYGVDYHILDIHTDKNAMKEFKEAGWKTVPQIQHEDYHIGGYDKLEEYLRVWHSIKARHEAEAYD